MSKIVPECSDAGAPMKRQQTAAQRTLATMQTAFLNHEQNQKEGTASCGTNGFGRAETVNTLSKGATAVLESFGTQMMADFGRAASHVIDNGFYQNFKYLLMMVWVVVASNAYSFFAKICYGDPEGRPSSPAKSAMIAIALFSCSVFYFVTNMMVYQEGPGRMLQRCLKADYWVATLPYSIGHVATYILYLQALTHISASTAVTVSQTRLFFDVFILYFFSSKPMGMSTLFIILSIFIMAATHFVMMPDDEKSLDAQAGFETLMTYTIVMAMTYMYFPWALPRFKLPTSICLFIASVQMSLCAFVGYIMQNRGPAGFFDGIEMVDVYFIISWVAIDAALFLCPLWLSPVTFSFLITVQIPGLYMLENWWFDVVFDKGVLLSAIAVLFVVLGHTRYELEACAFAARLARLNKGKGT